ncbi:MAG: CapA family protein [Parasporobacterium sp.]|nr:CapA family protein [Parasporobacterium sp.]
MAVRRPKAAMAQEEIQKREELLEASAKAAVEEISQPEAVNAAEEIPVIAPAGYTPAAAEADAPVINPDKVAEIQNAPTGPKSITMTMEELKNEIARKRMSTIEADEIEISSRPVKAIEQPELTHSYATEKPAPPEEKPVVRTERPRMERTVVTIPAGRAASERPAERSASARTAERPRAERAQEASSSERPQAQRAQAARPAAERQQTGRSTESRSAEGARTRRSSSGDERRIYTPGHSGETDTQRAARKRLEETRTIKRSADSSDQREIDRKIRQAAVANVGTEHERQAQSKARPAKKKKSKAGPIIAIILAVLIIAAAVVAVFVLDVFHMKENAGADTQPTEAAESSLAGPPAPAIAGTASIGATGDILLHDSVLAGANYGDYYDFSGQFAAAAPYWSQYDIMVANLEVTCGGPETGEYRGYPTFNAPDQIVTDLKNAGVDCLLTCNNHAYDTGEYGFYRTLDVISENGLDYLGTRKNTDESYVRIKDVNGIKIGMVAYTYDTREYPDEQKSLNGNVLSDEASDCVNSFCYSDKEAFYAKAAEAAAEMTNAGCDVKVFFIHWGYEYMDYPAEDQQEMAQRVADLGADIIIGGHPHVIQEFATLDRADGGKTYCLYSMGNTLSAQRRALMNEDDYRGYTEDGLVFSVSYVKFNNGKVKLKEVSVLPMWVEERSEIGYAVVTMDSNEPVGNWPAYDTYSAMESYNRTMGRIGEEYYEVRKELGNAEQPAVIE